LEHCGANRQSSLTAQAPDKVKPASSAQTPEIAKPSQGTAPKAADTVAPRSTEQHAKIRETLRGEKAERLTKVPFSISIGEAIPRTVHFYRLPATGSDRGIRSAISRL
jgi:hypothetical protein